MALNNPAGRLLSLITDLKGHSTANPQQNIYDGWANVLGYKTDGKQDDVHVMRSIALIARLPEEVAIRMNALDEEATEHHIVWVQTVEERLKIRNLDTKLDSMVKIFDESKMGLVAICDGILSRQAPEPYVEMKRIEEIKREMATLIKEIAIEKGMPEHIREFMLKHLDIVYHACCDYRITAMTGINETVEWSIGNIYMNKSVCQEAAKTNAGTSFFNTLGRLLMLASAFERLKALAEEFFPKLLE